MELEAKRNKFITSLSEFLAVTTPEVLGCIWISPNSLSQREKPFDWFNYIFNGVLETQISNFPTQEKSFLKTDQFENSFHLLHLQQSCKQIDKEYSQFINIIKNKKTEALPIPKLLILSNRSDSFQDLLKNKSPDFKHLLYLY